MIRRDHDPTERGGALEMTIISSAQQLLVGSRCHIDITASEPGDNPSINALIDVQPKRQFPGLILFRPPGNATRILPDQLGHQ